MTEEQSFTGSPLPEFFAALLVLAVAIALLVAIGARGGDVSLALKDPATVTGRPVYLGAISNAGAVLLVIAATACFVASTAGTKEARLLKLVAMFSGLMAVDDLFLLHEGPIRDHLPWFETFFFLLYAALAAAALVLMGRRLVRVRQLPIVVAIGLMAVSVGIDLSPWAFPSKSVVEDLSKFGGFAIWAAYWSRVSVDVVRNLRSETQRSMD